MIAVIADDITGAAEIGGIALSHGILCEVQTAFSPVDDVGMLIIDTDSRSHDVASAIKSVEAAAKALVAIAPEWVYKKTDSALRGHVVEEILAIHRIMGFQRCLLVPGNPHTGRVVRNGQYLIDGIPLQQTDFAHDPEYPAATSDVITILGGSHWADICLLKPGMPQPAHGISVGEVHGVEDLASWTWSIDITALPAGGGAFFSTLLEAKGFRQRKPPSQIAAGRTLIVCGSGAESSRQSLADARKQGLPVYAMPADVFGGDNIRQGLEAWESDVAASLRTHSLAIAAIDRPAVRDSALALRLRNHTANLAASALSSCDVEHLYIEGGATAAAIISRLGLTRFRPVGQPAPGVVTMRAVERPELSVTVKPGTYKWPPRMWQALAP